MSCPDCEDDISIGDIVEHRMNPDVFGIVIGFAGSLVYIRTSPMLTTMQFHEWELQHAERVVAPPAKEENPPSAEIINIDEFLRRVKPAGRA